jgi:BNR repeat-like domain
MKRMGLMIAALVLFLFAQLAQADWIASRRLTWTSGDSTVPSITVGLGNTIHVVWYDNTPGNEEIYHKRSTDGGQTWGVAKRLTWTSGISRNPAIATDSSGGIHLVWQDDTPGNLEIYYKRSTDGGTTWSAAKRLTWTSSISQNPAIATDSSGGIHLVWGDYTPGNPEIYYKRSTDGGTTWSAAKRLTWSGKAVDPTIATGSSNTVHLVWTDGTPGNPEIYYKRSTDGGTAWSAAKRLTWTSGQSFYPALATASSGGIHVVWSDDTPGNREVYYKRSTDGGATWSAAKRLSWTTDISECPDIAIDSSDTVHVAWDENALANDEIYYRTSTNGGATWSAVTRLTWNSGDSRLPAIAIDSSDAVHIVWEDDTPGNYEIYYRTDAGFIL